MKALHSIQKHILDTLEDGSEMHLNDIFANLQDVKKPTRDYHVKQLMSRGDIERVKNGVYRKPTADIHTQFKAARQKFRSDSRSEEDNKETINKLLNTYDEVLVIFQSWVLQNITNQSIDFEQQLLFIENFKWLTMIADKLMKRWSLEHVGYDTNTRQAQEDAKAKTAEREKAALKDAPIEEQVNVVGSFDLDTKQLIEGFPKLEDMTEEEKEETKV